jgi:hypothetical protein
MVEISNLGRVEKLFLELPKKEEKVLDKNSFSFVKSVRRTAKQMAPKDTGELAASIRLKPTKIKGKTKQYLLEVGSQHAAVQEFGFAPHYAYIQNSSKLAPGFYFVKKNTPFVRPAIERNISRFLQNLNTDTREALTA